MKLEDQVAPPELARQLETAGFPQETVLAWFECDDGSFELLPNPTRRNDLAWNGIITEDSGGYRCAAPTDAEMGEWLPDQVKDHFFDVVKFVGGWTARYAILDQAAACMAEIMPCSGATEAEARARLLVALVEAGALDPKGLR